MSNGDSDPDAGLATDSERLLYAVQLASDARHLRAIGREGDARGKTRQARDLLDAVLDTEA